MLTYKIETFFETFRKSAGTRHSAVTIAQYAVEQLGARTVEEMLDTVTEAELLRIKGFGQRSMEMLREILTKSGLPQLEPGVLVNVEPEAKVHYQLRHKSGDRSWLPPIFDTEKDAEVYLEGDLVLYEVTTTITKRLAHPWV